LHKHVHVLLASFNAVLVSLEAVQERLIEAHAWALLLLLSHLLRRLLVDWLSILNWSLLHLLLLLLLLRGLTVTGATTHDASDSLMGDLRTSTHGHTCGESTAEATTANTSTNLGSGSGSVVMMVNLLRRGLLMMHGGSWGRSCGSGTPA